MKLHLGCGRRYIPGFVHIDVIDHPHVDHVSSIDNLSFLQDGSVELIYNCHVLEHFKRREVRRYAWRETEHANVDDSSRAYIPHVDQERGVLIGLNGECLRPAA